MRRKVLPMNLVAARSVVLRVRHNPEGDAVVAMANQIVRCMLQFVLPAVKKRLYPSSPVVTGRFTAGIALNPNPGAIAGKYSGYGLPGFLCDSGEFCYFIS